MDTNHRFGGWHNPEPKTQALDLSATLEQLALYAGPMVTGLRQAMEKLGTSFAAAQPKPRSRQRQLLEAARYDLWYAWDRGTRKYALDQIRAAAKEDARTARVLGPVRVTGTWAKGGRP